MGLLSKVKAAGGIIKGKASSLGAKIVDKVKSKPKLTSGAKLAAGTLVSVARKNPAVAIAGIGVAAAGATYALGKKLGAKSKEKKMAKQASAMAAKPSPISTAPRPQSILEKAKTFAQEHPILTAAGAAAAGGIAGAVISAAVTKRKKKKATKKAKSKRKKVSRGKRKGKVSFYTKDGRYVSFTPGKRKARRTKRRKGHFTQKEVRNLMRIMRRDMND